MDLMLVLIILTIGFTLIFDFINGFHDAANAIATVVSTHVLKPHYAVIWSATFNFLAVFIFGVHVATTIGTGLINPDIIDPPLILSALIGAILWNLITWYYGLPSSSSHALIGGLVGAALVKGGVSSLMAPGLIKTIVSIVLSPLLGCILSLLCLSFFTLTQLKSRPMQVDKRFRQWQLLSCALLSLGHGGNDAQKSMGIIAILLASGGLIHGEFHIPLWVIIACYSMMALGTLFGGFRIVKTMGMRLTKLKPISGAAAEIGSGITLFLASTLGIPVSTTHTITGGIIGVGMFNRPSSVRWGLADHILLAWILTLPASAFIAACIEALIRNAVL